jgi:uncharacterized protein YlzI (FlbEa/FlbD family)
MIELLGLSGKTIFVNHELIRTMEEGPETILCFVDGTRIPVRNKPPEILEKMIQFKLRLQQLQIQE